MHIKAAYHIVQWVASSRYLTSLSVISSIIEYRMHIATYISTQVSKELYGVVQS